MTKSNLITPFSSSIASSNSLSVFSLAVLTLAVAVPYQSILKLTVFVIGISWLAYVTYVPVKVTLFTLL